MEVGSGVTLGSFVEVDSGEGVEVRVGVYCRMTNSGFWGAQEARRAPPVNRPNVLRASLLERISGDFAMAIG